MIKAVTVSGIVGRVEPGYEMHSGGGDAKMEKDYFISSNKSNFTRTRVELKLKRPIEWIDSVNQLGLPDDTASYMYALENDFGEVSDGKSSSSREELPSDSIDWLKIITAITITIQLTNSSNIYSVEYSQHDHPSRSNEAVVSDPEQFHPERSNPSSKPALDKVTSARVVEERRYWRLG